MRFSKVPRLNMEDPQDAVQRLSTYLIKQQDELEWRFLNLDSDNVYEIDCEKTHMKNMELPSNVITEVIHEQVINVETAHILNAWIKNLFVEYLETNMDARLDRTSVERHFIRIRGVNEEMVQQILDPKEIEDLLIPDPRGTGAFINVYFTAIGDHPDAYMYFTITNPKEIHKDLTDQEVEAFKVKVKKITAELVKYQKGFSEIIMADGSRTVTPTEVWGMGTDVTGQTDKGKVFIFKDIDAYVIRYVKENGEFNELRVGENGVTASNDAYIEFATLPLQPTSTVLFDRKYLHKPVITALVCGVTGAHTPLITLLVDNNKYFGCTVTFNSITELVPYGYTSIQVIGKGATL